MKTRALFAVVFVAWAGVASAAGTRKAFVVQQHFTLAANGTLVLENTAGNIEIIGGDVNGVHVDAQKVIFANDAEGIEEGRQLTALKVAGDENLRVLRTVMEPGKTRPWSSGVSWRLRVPRTVTVRVSSNAGDFIRIFDVRGGVFAKNFNGTISFENVAGFVSADSVNGSISLDAPRLRHEARLVTVNGHITVRVGADADLRWVADTVRGDIRTNLPVRGMFNGTTFRGSVNAPGGPTLHTASFLGHIHLYGAGMPVQTAKSVRSMRPELVFVDSPNRERKVGALRQGVVNGNFSHETNIGDIQVREVRGNASLSTGAGKVQLGAAAGDAVIVSKGGALQLGEILGSLRASTQAGDILVEAARRGGIIDTTGGTIRLLYTGGPTRLTSGGGDVVVRQAAGPVNATTRSGDINIGIDRTSKKQRIDAITEKGNIVLNVPDGFGADVDLTVFTTDPNAHTIHSDIAGLSIQRDQAAEGVTRIRATGKLNGGGDRVTMQATGGSIRIVTGTLGPTVLGR
jgi:DUF4097 and DUF4098 domain-containing protein YvlB